MTLEQIGIIVAIVVPLVGLAYGWFAFGGRFAKIELKVDTIWDFHMRRAMSEAAQRGFGSLNSPFTIDTKAQEWFASLANQLRDFHARLGRRLSDSELALEIERHYGTQILKEVCIPNGLSQGACLLIAAAVAKQDGQFEVPDQVSALQERKGSHEPRRPAPRSRPVP